MELHRWRHRFQIVLGAAVIACALSSSAAAQGVVSGEIQGKVVDESGAILPGVTVTVTSPALQVAQMVVVTDVGDSNLAQRLAISSYGVIAQPTIEIEGINTQTAADANGSVIMGGSVLEEVQVRAAANDVEVSQPGVSLIGIIKSGSNEFHGT